MQRDEIRTIARERFGWDEVRSGQLEAVEALLEGRDVLGVMPTGYGKSAIYELAGALIPGATVVISPLVALQADQVRAIEGAPDAPEAAAVNASLGDAANRRTWERLAAGDLEYLLLAPEQLTAPETLDRLRDARVRLLVVDEAHCVSAWGHDFRPDYLALGEVVERLGHPAVLALTATGAAPVRADIIDALHLRDPLVLARGFDRPNLHLEVRRHGSDDDKRAAVIDQVAELEAPGLLYVATRRDTERYAEALRERGLRVEGYHGALARKRRTAVHEAFQNGEVDVVVATSAFGMGIDKADVRFVVHADVPDSLDSYYQEIGRAGRDGEPAATTLHYRPEDLGLRRFFVAGSPDPSDVAAVWKALCAEPGIGRRELATNAGLPSRRSGTIVNLLEAVDLVTIARRGIRPAADLAPREAAERALEAAESRQRIDESRIAMLRSYAETFGCRRQALLGYFGDDYEGLCGNCDTCASGSAEEHRPEDAADERFAVEAGVTHAEWGRGTVMAIEGDRITVFFESEGYKVLSRALVDDKNLLEPVAG